MLLDKVTVSHLAARKLVTVTCCNTFMDILSVMCCGLKAGSKTTREAIRQQCQVRHIYLSTVPDSTVCAIFFATTQFIMKNKTYSLLERKWHY